MMWNYMTPVSAHSRTWQVWTPWIWRNMPDCWNKWIWHKMSHQNRVVAKKNWIDFEMLFFLNQWIKQQRNPATTQPSKNNMSFSKTRTTYCPSTHPKNKTNPSANIEISIQVFPAPTYAELCNLRNKLPMDANCDQIAWKHALDMEIRRCAPPPAWSRKEQAPPTQHARIGSAPHIHLHAGANGTDSSGHSQQKMN